MGLSNKLIISSIFILIGCVIIHEYLPQYIVLLMKYQTFRDISNVIHQVHSQYFSSGEYASANPPLSYLDKLFTVEELKSYDGRDESKGLYLAILGTVYDVEKGRKFYGPGGGYEFFAGRDGTRAFVSGDFSEEGLTDDISQLTNQDYLGLVEWVQFYNKEYKIVGKLIGRYYNEKGKPTAYYLQTQKWFREAQSHKDAEEKEKYLFPPCNSEWSPETGSRVYCTKKSGGVQRNWVGVPRKLFTPGGKNERCACVKNFGPPSDNPTKSPQTNTGDLDNPNLREYPGCDSHKDSCLVPNK